MNAEEIRSKVVSFVQGYYKIYGVGPPIALVCKETGLNRRKLYSAFSSGQREICQKAGIPVPERVEHARKIWRVEKVASPPIEEKPARAEGSAPLGFQLTGKQVERLYGLLHLEKRTSIHKIVDTLLDIDADLRLKHGLQSVAEIAKAIELAREIEETGVDVKELVDNYRLFKQAGVPFTPNQLNTLASFLQALIDGGWSPSEIPNYVTTLWLCDVTKFTQDDIYGLIELFDSARKESKSVTEFIKEVNEERQKQESLKEEIERLSKEVDDLRRKKESETMELRNLEEAKRMIIKEINEARPWDKKGVMEMLKALRVASSSSEKGAIFRQKS
jgi:hypothetical protein